jgi:hypothetical protein
MMTDTNAGRATAEVAFPAEAEAAFQRYLESTVEYNSAIVAAGDTPWHGGDIERRRELFMRKYRHPDAPKDLSIPNIRRSA